jgi:membrane-anchored protein YejM (alkaline phosphatase superfamily)
MFYNFAVFNTKKILIMQRSIYKLLLVAFIFPISDLKAQKNNARPNIIYIMADDLGYADLSCYGRKDYQTPNLDKLCSQGIKFMNAYAAAPVCTPTRVAFFTGDTRAFNSRFV